MSYSDDISYQIAQILENNGIGTYATDIFISKEPENPDNCVTVYSTGGLPDGCLDRDARENERLLFQIRVRNNKYLSAHSKMEDIRTVLEKELLNYDSGTFSVIIESLPIPLQRDTKNRVIIVVNCSCLRKF